MDSHELAQSLLKHRRCNVAIKVITEWDMEAQYIQLGDHEFEKEDPAAICKDEVVKYDPILDAMIIHAGIVINRGESTEV